MSSDFQSSELEVIWVPVTGYECLYEVSNDGRVRSFVRGGPDSPKVLLGNYSARGYRRVDLHKDGLKRSVMVHRLVCAAFHGEPPPGSPMALHWDDDRSNNRADNLRWGSHADNVGDRIRNGIGTRPWATHCKNGHEYDDENRQWQRRWGSGDLMCQVCKKCTRLRNERRRGTLESDDPRHGTPAGYSSWGCRCDPCRSARSDYMKIFRQKRKSV